MLLLPDLVLLRHREKEPQHLPGAFVIELLHWFLFLLIVVLFWLVVALYRPCFLIEFMFIFHLLFCLFCQPNAAGFVVGTITTLLFVVLTEQRMGSTLLAMAAMAAAVLALMFGDVMLAEEATQWTANIGILQAVVMLGSGCAVWPTVRRHCTTHDAAICLADDEWVMRAGHARKGR